MFTQFTIRSTHILLAESCIPTNQPLKAMRDMVAGAAQMRIKKYFNANSITSGVPSTTSKANRE